MQFTMPLESAAGKGIPMRDLGFQSPVGHSNESSLRSRCTILVTEVAERRTPSGTEKLLADVSLGTQKPGYPRGNRFLQAPAGNNLLSSTERFRRDWRIDIAATFGA